MNFTTEGRFADGVRLLAKTGPAGVRFEGSSGSLFVSREKLETEPASLAKEPIGERELHLYASDHHYDNFFRCIRKILSREHWLTGAVEEGRAFGPVHFLLRDRRRRTHFTAWRRFLCPRNHRWRPGASR